MKEMLSIIRLRNNTAYVVFSRHYGFLQISN